MSRALLALLLFSIPAFADHCRPRGAWRWSRCRVERIRVTRCVPCDRWRPRHVSCGWYRAPVRIAPLFTRFSVALSLDDPLFWTRGESDFDGAPQERAGPVGARFLIDSGG
ncbi:MAG: hypothetical protein ACREID_02445 [Planctomycetota bacterium]